MTANQDQIQRLLSEIEEVLAQGNSRLPWGSAAQLARQRQVLEQIRLYLENALYQLSQEKPEQNQAQDVMQAVIEEMNALRSTLLHPLHSEVSSLMQQRNALLREIRQLEAHRELLAQPSPPASEAVPVEKLQVVHDRADQVLSTLDSTLHVVFESLQKDIQAYQDSLSQGIDKLHSLGQQSEIMFSGIVGRMTAQMGQNASSFLQGTPNSAQLPQLAMPYAGSELSPVKFQRDSSIDSITVLTELIDQLAVEVDEFPVTVPVVPPRKGSISGQEAPAELKSLFQGDLPKVEPIVEPNGYSALSEETTFDQLRLSASTGFSSAETPTVFTLEGVDDLFENVEDVFENDDKNQTKE
ncbi:hypothetical protein IQ250_10320 [Pseudanabaenaceae cyanobacterium LEGE 13415]|nr:hypothetical protein [Pseudanabaenaceae cyanobacterium LEGE 13415]